MGSLTKRYQDTNGGKVSRDDLPFSTVCNDSLLPSLKGYAIQDELRLQLMNWGEYTIKIMPQSISCSVFKK